MPNSQSDLGVLAVELKKWNRRANIAGIITLAIVILALFTTDSDKIKEYSFLIAFVPAFLVYILVRLYGNQAARKKSGVRS